MNRLSSRINNVPLAVVCLFAIYGAAAIIGYQCGAPEWADSAVQGGISIIAFTLTWWLVGLAIDKPEKRP